MRTVIASYKTGQYIGVEQDERNQMVLIEVLAVIKHPWQGDLHQAKKADVTFFQERKALSFREKAWVPLHTIQDYTGAIPSYDVSLKQAVETYIHELHQDGSEWAERSLECLSALKKDYKID
jgi:kinase-associated protein B